MRVFIVLLGRDEVQKVKFVFEPGCWPLVSVALIFTPRVIFAQQGLEEEQYRRVEDVFVVFHVHY